MSRWNHPNQGFKKGHTTNVGRVCTEETRAKIGLASKGKKLSEERKRNISLAQRGRKLSEKHKRKISNALKGLMPKNIKLLVGYWKGKKMSDEARQKMRMAKLGKVGNNKGYKFTEKQRQRLSEGHKGQKSWNKGLEWIKFRRENHPRWISDRSKLKRYGEDNLDRRSSAYNYWRKQVWLRDNFKCKIANPDCTGRIEVHHILGWKDYPELRYELNNGITLCHAHHPRKRAEEKRLSPYFQELVSVSKNAFCK